MKRQEKPKMYVIRKYVMAKDAPSAIRKDKTTKVHDVWVKDDWQEKHLADAIGFHVIEEEYEEG